MINVDTFKGAIPQAAGKRLPDGYAWRARHCDLSDGSLRAGKFIDDGTAGRPEVLSYYAAPKTIYPIKANKFLEWDQIVSVCPSPILNNTARRVIYVEPGAAPKQTDSNLATAGAQPYPSAWYYLGVPQPTGTFGAAVVGGSGTTETRAYVYTYVTAWGEEGLPSDPQLATGFINGVWAVTGMNTAGPGIGYNITRKRIYRVVTGSSSAEYLFVDEVALGDASYPDTKTSTQLGEVIPSADWFPPPANLKQIVVLPSGVCVGHDGASLFATEPNVPHAWPFQIPVDVPIAALAVFGDRVFVATLGNPYVLSGLTPDQFILNKFAAVGSNRMAIPPVSNGTSVYYQTNRGLLAVGDGGTQNLSNKHFHPHQKLYQVSMAAWVDDNFVVQSATELVSSTHTGKQERYARPFMIEGLATGEGVVQLPEWDGISAYCEDNRQLNPGTEDIFAAKAGHIRAVLTPIEGRYFNAQKPYTWTSKLQMLPRPVAFTVLKVEAEFRDLSNLMQNRDAAREENLRLLKALLGRQQLNRGEIVGCAGLGEHWYGAYDYGGSAFSTVHTDPFTNFAGVDGEAIDFTSLTPTEIDTPSISGDVDEYGGVELAGIDYAGNNVMLVYPTVAGASSPRFREPWIRVRIWANADYARGESYLEGEPTEKQRTLMFDDLVVSDRVYMFNADQSAGANIKSDCWQVEIEGLAPVYRVTTCQTVEELESV